MRGFSDEERERIDRQLREAGRELFARYGLDRTTIADLTEPAGIADSTFYRFYDSKEDLYVAILEAQSERVAREVIGRSFEAHPDDPEAAIAAFLTAITGEIETNPLIRRVVVEDELDRLRERRTPAELEREAEESVAYFLPYVREWYEEGRIEGPDPETVAHAIRAVTFVTLHEDDVGESHYPATRDALIEAVARGFARDPDEDGAN